MSRTRVRRASRPLGIVVVVDDDCDDCDDDGCDDCDDDGCDDCDDDDDDCDDDGCDDDDDVVDPRGSPHPRTSHLCPFGQPTKPKNALFFNVFGAEGAVNTEKHSVF